MNYLTKFFFIIFIFLNSIIFADDNKILFKVNGNIFSTVDLKNRIKYLEILNSSNFESEMKIELINDYFTLEGTCNNINSILLKPPKEADI